MKKRLYDYVTKDMKMISIGTFICLIAVFGALNYGIVANFFTRILSFFVGAIFSYFVYLIIFLIGLYFIFYSKRKKINFDITILGVVLLFLGGIIVVTNAMYLGEDGSYITFQNGKFNEYFLEAISATKIFPKVDYSKNCGVIGIILTAIINSGMTYIGSYVIGSTFIATGLILSFAKIMIRFTKILKDYNEKLIKKDNSLKEAVDVSIDKKSVLSFNNEDKKVDLNIQSNLDKSPITNDLFFKEKPIYNANNDLESGLKKATLDASIFNNNNNSYDESTFINDFENNKVSINQNSEFNKKEETSNDDLIIDEDISKESDNNISDNTVYVKEEIKPKEIIEQKDYVYSRPMDSISRIDLYNDEEETSNEQFIENEAKPIKQFSNDISSKVTNYDFPPSTLLMTRQNSKNDDLNKQTAEERIEIINKLCRDFGFGGHIESYQIGPSVTRYDLKVDESTQVSKFSNYIEDLSVRLGGYKARFETIVPNKKTSGIEVQNAKSNIVDFKDVYEHLPELDLKKYNGLLIPFGKDISGNYIKADLREFPHMLICGTTGSGKSVFMQTMIMTMIMRNSPEDLRLFIIDPKRVEFSKYREIPHLLGPICSEPIEAYNALTKLVDIMEKRYKIFVDTDVTDIKEYNKEYAPRHNVKRLPYIVVVIDEYSNLVDGFKKVSEPVLSIAQKARACGIHLIIATQAPRTSIITGVIKANLPTRVALLCANTTDSQNVIDVGGAERLLGNGDMLIKSPLISTVGCSRVQGAFVETKEIKTVVDYIKARYGSDYIYEFTDLKDHSKDQVQDNNISAIEKAHDALYEEVKEYAMSMDYCSISKITRTFNIGFGRAGKIFEQLKRDGVLDSTPQGNDSKGTRVLLHNNYFNQSSHPGTTEQAEINSLEDID